MLINVLSTYHVFCLAVVCAFQGLLIAQSNIPQYEIDALYDLYNATSGNNWRWNKNGNQWVFSGDPNPCVDNWQGIVCTNQSLSNVFVSSINLDNFNLVGSLSPSIGNFTEIVVLSLNGNTITGLLPEELGNLNNTFRLTFYTNKLTGTIPASLANIQNLQYLILFDNYLQGTIPPALGQLTQLVGLRLDENNLIGPIPDTLCNMQSLYGFIVKGNYLNGTIPSCLGTLSGLQVIALFNNELTGPIPNTFSDLTLLAALELQNNYLTGTLPEIFAANLNYLVLNNNQLQGTIPASYNILTELMQFDLSYNALSGAIPDLSGLKHISKMYLNNNHLNGSIPASLWSLVSLSQLDLDDNFLSGSLDLSQYTFYNNGLSLLNLANNLLTGEIPDQLGAMTRLQSLSLAYNHFQGTIPEELGSIFQLVYLNLNNNNLEGTIPSSLGSLKFLVELNLESNALTGTFPSQMDYSSGFYALVIADNLLTGPLPANLTQLHMLVYIVASGNLLTGSVPAELQSLTALTVVEINDNLLSGSLPSQVSQLGSLQTLFVYNNLFSGALDMVFNAASQTQLMYIDVSNNHFSGTIPSQPFQIAGLVSFAAVSNCLYGEIPSEQICALVNMTSLAMDGMQSASVCQYLFFPDLPFVYPAYGIWKEVRGGVAGCLFSMPKLETLHLSGNGISGTISSDVTVSSSLMDLSLSHNNLGGPVPDALQHHPWRNFDLSFNKLSGVLSTSFPAYSSNATLYLEVNRLSGDIPSSLVTAEKIDMLDSNLFACRTDRSDLPVHDQSTDIYECGSNSFNYSLYAWLAVCFTVGGLVVAAWLVTMRGRLQKGPVERYVDASVRKVHQWMSVFRVDEDSSDAQTLASRANIVAFGHFAGALRRSNLIITAYILCVMIPVYVSLTHYYNTYTFEYAWTVSATYLCSLPATLVLFFAFAALSLLCVAALRSLIKHNKKALTISTYKMSSIPLCLYVSFLSVVVLNISLVTGVNVAYVYIHYTYSSNIVHLSQFALAIFKLLWNNLAVRELLRLTKRFEKFTQPEDDVNGIRMSTMSTTATNGNSRSGQQHRIGVEVLMILFNNLGAPFIATALVSSNCFYAVFAAPPEVVVSYQYASCVSTEYGVNGSMCISYDDVQTRSTSYMPPFIYSYQCSSTFITTYATIYVFMFVIAAFVSPLVLYVLRLLHRRTADDSLVHWLVSLGMPKILKPAETRPQKGGPGDEVRGSLTVNDNVYMVYMSSGGADEQPVFHCDLCVVKIVNIFAMLVTFGAVLPPLAVVGTVTLYSFTYYTQLMIGRFVTRLSAAQRVHFTEAINRDCENAANMFMSSVWIVVPFASIFYALLLLDTLGDEVGWRAALWAPILTLLLPVVTWGFYSLCKSVIRHRFGSMSFRSSQLKKDSFFKDYEPLLIQERGGQDSPLSRPLIDKNNKL